MGHSEKYLEFFQIFENFCKTVSCRANATFSPSPIRKTKFARNSDNSDDDDDDDNPIYKLLNSMRKKNNAKKNKS